MRACCECPGWHTCQTRGWRRTTHIKVDFFPAAIRKSIYRFVETKWTTYIGKYLWICWKLFTDIRNYFPTWRILDKCVLTSLAPFTSELRPLWAPCWCFAMTSACEYPQLTQTEFWACSKLSAGNLYLRTHLRVRSVWSARQVLELPEAKIVPRNLLARRFRFDTTLPSVRNDINHLRHLIVYIHILVYLAYRRNILRRHTSFQPIYSHLYCSFQVKWYHTDIISEK